MRLNQAVFKKKYFSIAHGETARGRVPAKFNKRVFCRAHKFQSVRCAATSHRTLHTQVTFSSPEKYRSLVFVCNRSGNEPEKRRPPQRVAKSNNSSYLTTLSQTRMHGARDIARLCLSLPICPL